jgi:deoxyribonuclease V
MLPHRWDVSPSEALRVQEQLCARVHIRPLAHPPRTVGGLDVHGDRGAAVVLRWPDLTWVTGAIAECPVAFPYLPGLLSFREMPPLLAAIDQLDTMPDVFICDGHGLAHPRRFGLACHLGIWLGRPTIGCAKTRLCGRHTEPATERGATVQLHGREVIGAVVRTRTNVKPVYVSVGHQVTLSDAVEIVLGCTPRYRLPEPVRMAHKMAKNGCRHSPSGRGV